MFKNENTSIFWAMKFEATHFLKLNELSLVQNIYFCINISMFNSDGQIYYLKKIKNAAKNIY